VENPDVELELTRSEDGNVTYMAYKVHNRENGGKSALEFCELASTMLEAEGHELIGVHVHSVDVLGSITS